MIIPDELIKAYEATTYVIYAEPIRIKFRVGRECRELDRLLEASGHFEWVYMTAFNPYSIPVSEGENDRRQELLCKTLQLNQRDFLRGEGISDNGDWPNEPALFILGMPREKGVAFGRVFEQYAIIHGRIGQASEFAFC
jgi:hypothetical protein